MRRVKLIGLLASAALLAGACSGGGDPANPSTDAPANGASTTEAANGTAAQYATGTTIPLPLSPADITWVHNATDGPLQAYFADVADQFMAQHPGVTVTISSMANDHLRETILPTALDAGGEPDLFQSWGGGEVVNWVNIGAVMDLSAALEPTVGTLGANAGSWVLDGAAFGLPYAVGPAGFWVNLNVLNDAGMVQGATLDAAGNVTGGTVDWPSDMAGLYDMWDAISANTDAAPVALGGGSPWAAAWWYYALVTKICSPQAIMAAGDYHDFTDECWQQAVSELGSVIGRNPFAAGWQDAPVTGGADSSAGQLVLGEAAMELMGPWAGRDLANAWQAAGSGDGSLPDFISWYPVPAVINGAGANSIMAGGDGFSVLAPARGSQARSDAAAALLAFLLSDQVQAEGAAFPWHGGTVDALPGIPANPVAANETADSPIAARQAEAITQATFVTPWLDTSLGQAIGNPMTDAVNGYMRGHGSAAGILTAINQAAGNY